MRRRPGPGRGSTTRKAMLAAAFRRVNTRPPRAPPGPPRRPHVRAPMPNRETTSATVSRCAVTTFGASRARRRRRRASGTASWSARCGSTAPSVSRNCSSVRAARSPRTSGPDARARPGTRRRRGSPRTRASRSRNDPGEAAGTSTTSHAALETPRLPQPLPRGVRLPPRDVALDGLRRARRARGSRTQRAARLEAEAGRPRPRRHLAPGSRRRPAGRSRRARARSARPGPGAPTAAAQWRDR